MSYLNSKENFSVLSENKGSEQLNPPMALSIYSNIQVNSRVRV
jgi:hypothetical protein